MSKVARYNGRSAPQLATDAEAAVRGIAHLAEAYDDPLTPDAIYRTLSGLTRLLENIPDAVTRLRAAMLHQHEAGAVSIAAAPYAGHPDEAVTAMSNAVEAMLASFGAVRTGLDDAQAAISGIRSVTQSRDG